MDSESLVRFGVLLFGLVTIATGLICQFPHCETVKCDPVTNCSGEYRKSGGGYCGCCPACFTFIGKFRYFTFSIAFSDSSAD